MKALFVQLSDIHMHAAGNAVLGREERIAEAAAALDADVAFCVLLITGDVAQSGSEEEYGVGLEFISAVRVSLAGRLPGVPVECAVIPGNHDCDLRSDQTARDVLIASVLAAKERAISSSVVDLCTAVQRSFFDLRGALDTGSLAGTGKLYYEYQFSVGAECIEIRCLNTSWLSQRREKEGSLYYPVAEIPDRNPDAAVALTVLHHPFNWFPNENKRELQRRVEQVSDLIFTGHEHAHTRRTQLLSTGETNEFIEGVALQVPWDADDSGFNALVVDIGTKRQLFARYEWSASEAIYERAGAVEWEPFHVNRLRARNDFVPSAEFAAFLEDPGAGYEKSGKGRVKLSEIFVFPEMREMSLKLTEAPGAIRGEEVFEESFYRRHLLISGPERSGKSCLAKALVQRLLARGYVPLLLDGETFTPQTDDRLQDLLERRFASQYDKVAIERYRQLDPSRRVVIIDGLHKVKVRRHAIAQLLTSLERFAGRVFLITNDLAHAFGEIVHAQSIIEERGNYAHFRLLPFGYLKRGELTSKWFMLDKTIDEEQLARRIKEADGAMEVVLGRNYVPAYPVFILAMLQGVDSAQQVDVGASTYGYFYELLIRNALAAGSSKTDFNIAVAYLTFTAYALFKMGKREVTEAELREITKRYSETYDISVDFDRMTRDLERRHVLFHMSDTYEFKYEYIYYYFVAKYLSDHITEETIRDVVRRHSRQLEHEESANILLFLAHLSTDPLIVDEMMANARAHFAGVEPARLEDDVEFLSELLPVLPPLSYVEGDVEVNRRAEAEYRDALARREEDGNGVNGDAELGEAYRLAQEHLNQLLAALKTLQILGQILKNHPGSIEASRKEAIARECYELGFRTLGSVYQFLREGRADLVEYVVQTLRQEKTESDHTKLITRANGVVLALALSAAYGIVKRISFAVGHQSLTQTYARVEGTLRSTATRLVNMSIRLDQVSGFPRGEIVGLSESMSERQVARAVLQWLVLTHINLFPVNFQERQRVCSALGIKYRALEGVDQRRKLIGAGR